MAPHPLDILSVDETNVARDAILSMHPDVVVDFREIYLQEPAKEELKKFLDLEHSAHLSSTSPRPKRLAKCQYDVVGADRVPEYHESVFCRWSVNIGILVWRDGLSCCLYSVNSGGISPAM